MALRLTDLVVRGEIFNTRWYSVYGWLELRGQESPLHLELTGNCCPDLAGWHLRFESRAAREETVARGADDQEGTEHAGEPDLSGLAWQQVGPTGTMTAARKVRVAACPPDMHGRRFALGEPPPKAEEWKRCLHLEWFSQNGRVVVELADPILEFVEFTEIKGVPPADGQSPILPSDEGDESTGALEITAIEADEDGGPQAGDLSPAGDDEDEMDEEPNPYRVIPEELEKALDSQSLELDRAIHQDDELSRSMWETELMDDLIERSEGEPLASLFESTLKFRRPEQLDDEQVETELKSLLGQLALYGVALDVCQHFTPRDVYRLLVEKVCPQEHAYPELRGTQWVQHFATSDFCRSCEEEFQREYEEEELRRKDRPDGDADDSDVPF